MSASNGPFGDESSLVQRYNYLFVGFAIFAFLGVVAVLVGFVTHYFTLSAENSRVQYGDLSRFERVVQRLGPSEASWARTFDDEYLAFPYNGLQIERRSSGLSRCPACRNDRCRSSRMEFLPVYRAIEGTGTDDP